MSALLAAGLALAPAAAEASGDEPGGGGPSANVPPVGAGGSGPTQSNVGSGVRNDLRYRSLTPGAGTGGAAGAGAGGGVIVPLPAAPPLPGPAAPKQ